MFVELGIECFVLFGMLLGGFVMMLFVVIKLGWLVGVLFNDVGLEIDVVGFLWICSYVGKGSVYLIWMYVVCVVVEGNGDIYFDWGIEDWLVMVKWLYWLNSLGCIVLDYDLKIVELFCVFGVEIGLDMWVVLLVLCDVLMLIVWGG